MTAPHIVATETRARPHYLRCDECGTPVAEVRDGLLIIKVKHRGDWHITVIPLAQLAERAA